MNEQIVDLSLVREGVRGQIRGPEMATLIKLDKDGGESQESA